MSLKLLRGVYVDITNDKAISQNSQKWLACTNYVYSKQKVVH